MSKIRNVTVAALCALGASVAMISPASAVGTANASYNCGDGWGTATASFTRTAPTTPATKNLVLVFTFNFQNISPTAVGGAVTTLSGPATPYPLTLTNPNVVPATSTWAPINIRTTGASATTLTGPPAAINLTLSNVGLDLTCTVVNADGWPI